MSKQSLKKEIQKLQRIVENAPRIWKFRGLRVVPADKWKYGDWSKFPDRFHLLAVICDGTPKDWLRDYYALLTQLQDPEYGRKLCYTCAIYQAQSTKKELDYHSKYWQQNGGQEAKEKFYKECGEPRASELRREDAMREAEWRLYDEIAGAENRTCDIINYFQCPCGDERHSLRKDGSAAREMWQHIEWYDRHWNHSTTREPPASERKWYHFNEPSVIDVGSLDDILTASEDSRLQEIIEEHERYMKVTGREIWAV